MKKIKSFTGAGLVSMLLFSGCTPGDSSPWIWQIEGKKITVTQLETAYDNFIDLMSMQLQVPVDQLKLMIANPEMGQTQRERMILANLNKEAYAEQYRTMILLNMEAEKSGFLDEPVNASKLEFFEQYFTANLFMNNSITSDNINVSDEEAMAYWEEVRKSNPQYRNVPIDEGINAARQQITQEKLFKKRQDMTKSILESYKIEKNKEFDLDGYFSKNNSAEDEGADNTDTTDAETGDTADSAGE